MDTVRIWLHLDAFNMAQGGAWEWRLGSEKLASEAWPGFPVGEMLATDAAIWLVGQALDWRARTPRLFP